jgi:lipid-binding SYLF domain-containing protein
MKKMKFALLASMAAVLLMMPRMLRAQDEKEKEKLIHESGQAKSEILKTDPSMSKLFADSYGYAIFPKIGKGAIIIGGSGGNGVVYEKGKQDGTAKLAQVSVGAQVGGESYREIIFFENKGALDRLKANKFEFSAQASAVALKAGASANAKYTDGAVVFTQDLSGLMAEAAVGGQKFTYKAP